MGVRRGSRVGARPPVNQFFFRYMGAFSATFSPCGCLFATFFSLWGGGLSPVWSGVLLLLFFPCGGGHFATFFTMWGPFCFFFTMWGAFFELPPPHENLCRHLDWRQYGNSLALCYYAVVMELPDSLSTNCKWRHFLEVLPDMTLIFIFKKEYIIFVKYVF